MNQPSSVLAGDLIEELKRRRLLVSANEIRREVAVVSSGLGELDRVCGGGLPRGCITEVVAPSCGGATVLYAMLAAATKRGEAVALVDPVDGFEVASAHAAGVDLERLLWVRACSRKEARRAAELILDTGGFGAVALDMGVRTKRASVVPAAAWMRMRKLASISGAVVLVLSEVGAVGTFASLAVEVRRNRVRWRGSGERWLEGVDLSFKLRRRR